MFQALVGPIKKAAHILRQVFLPTDILKEWADLGHLDPLDAEIQFIDVLNKYDPLWFKSE